MAGDHAALTGLSAKFGVDGVTGGNLARVMLVGVSGAGNSFFG